MKWQVHYWPYRKNNATYDGKGSRDEWRTFSDAPSAHRFAKYQVEMNDAEFAEVKQVND